MILKKNNPGLGVLLILAVIVSLGIVWAFWPGQFQEGDNLTYAILARNIARGRGVVHQSFVPQHLANLGRLPSADTEQPPVWPLVEAMFFLLLGPSDKVMMLSSGFFWILGLIMVWEISRQVFSKEVAWWSCLLYIFQPLLLNLSFSGLTEPFFNFLLLLISYWLVIDQATNYWIVGLTMGLMQWTKNIIWFFIPGVVWIMWKKKAKLADWLKLVSGWLLIESIFYLRKLTVIGGFYSSALLRSPEEISSLIRDFHVNTPTTFEFLERLSPMKLLENLVQLGWLWLVATYAFLIVFLYTWQIFYGHNRKTKRQTIWIEWGLLALLFNLLGTTVSLPSPRYAAPILVLVLPVAAVGLVGFFHKVRRGLSWWLVMVVVLLPLTIAVNREYFMMSKDMWLKPAVNVIGKANGLIITDQPVRMAWYSDHGMIFYPHNLEQMEQMKKNFDIAGIFLTRNGLLNNYSEDIWWQIFEGKKNDGIQQMASWDINGKKDAALYVFN